MRGFFAPWYCATNTPEYATIDWKKPTKTQDRVLAGRTDSNAGIEYLARNARSANCIAALLTMPSASGQDSLSISIYGRSGFTFGNYTKTHAEFPPVFRARPEFAT